MLDIIVTHYREPWEMGKPFFDMLACQRGINFSDIRVILVHDGVAPFKAQNFESYPYAVEQVKIPHGGVSKARNNGLERATAKWVQFCDFDDRYTNIYALKQVLGVLNEQDCDMIWTPFWMECYNGELYVKRMEKENLIWIHGKYYRREFLIENRVFFPEGIHYSEDSGFGAIVNELAKRRGKIKTEFPVYSWVYRPDSVSTDKANETKNLTGFIDRNVWVVEEFKRRGIDHINMVGRMFADAYWAFHQPGKSFPEEEERFNGIAKVYMNDLMKVDKHDLYLILMSARKNFKEFETDEQFTDWIARIRG